MKNENGFALATALTAAVVVSIIALAVLNMTLRRFELSTFRTDRAIAGAEADAGLQYVFARLTLDTTYTNPAFPGAVGFAAVVQAASAGGAPNHYEIRCHDLPGAENQIVPQLHLGAKINTERADDGTPGPLFGQYVGGKHLAIEVRFDPAGPGGAEQPYQIRAFAAYGNLTGGAAVEQ